jgi:RHH-type proline utilization regulon transcriptional repressor/proline dehydrogenase/delta 1-pyrroline-5-carboxylate dehydrogenase
MQSIALVQDWTAVTVKFDAVLHHGDAVTLKWVNQMLACRAGPIISVRAFSSGETSIPLESLVVERALSVNTAAAGGNASLMAIG